MNEKVGKRGSQLRLTGDRSWIGQPVIDRVGIRNRGKGDGITNRFVANRAMVASWNYRGNGDKDKVVFGNQAGAITKRANSVIDFGRDNVRDTFVFRNSVPGKPFNHMQRFVIKNFGREDVVRLENIGQTFRFKDLRRFGKVTFGFEGVPIDKLRVNLAPFA